MAVATGRRSAAGVAVGYAVSLCDADSVARATILGQSLMRPTSSAAAETMFPAKLLAAAIESCARILLLAWCSSRKHVFASELKR